MGKITRKNYNAKGYSAFENGFAKVWHVNDIYETTLPYKVYTATFVFNGSDLTTPLIVNVLQNTLADTLEYSVQEEGKFDYVITSGPNSYDIFTLNKTFITITAPSDDNTVLYSPTFSITTEREIVFRVLDSASATVTAVGTHGSPESSFGTLEIRVYN